MPNPDWVTYKESTHSVNAEGFDDVFNRPNRTIWANFTAEHNLDGSHISTLTQDSSIIDNGTYTGDGTDDRIIPMSTDMRIHALRVWSEETIFSIARSSGMTGDVSVYADGTSGTNLIQSISNVGEFEIGSDAAINDNGKTYYWFAIGAHVPQYTAWAEVADTLNEPGYSFNLPYKMAVYNSQIYVSSMLDGVTSGGIAKYTGSAWEFVGATTETQYPALLTFGGNLYAGTYPSGNLLRYNGTTLTSVAPNIADDTIYSLCEHNGSIYGATYSAAAGGKLVKWNGVDAWEIVATKYGSNNYLEIISFDGDIYGGVDGGGILLKWNGVDAWTKVADQYGTETTNWILCEYNAELYAGTSPNGKLYKFTGSAWEEKAGQISSQTLISALCVHNGDLYAGTYPGGKLLRWNGADAWVEIASQLNSQNRIMHLISFGGNLYGCTQPDGKLFKAV